MKRLALEVGLVVAVMVLGLEAVHYRNAVLECNVDNKRAWKTVRELREKIAVEGEKPGPGASANGSARSVDGMTPAR